MQNPGVLWFMIKKGQMAIKFRIIIEDLTGIIQKLLVAGFKAKSGSETRWFQRPIQICRYPLAGIRPSLRHSVLQHTKGLALRRDAKKSAPREDAESD
jgi:hypothetical protein